MMPLSFFENRGFGNLERSDSLSPAQEHLTHINPATDRGNPPSLSSNRIQIPTECHPGQLYSRVASTDGVS